MSEYNIESDHCPGLSKLIEEAGELIQASADYSRHTNGASLEVVKAMKILFEDEVADFIAATTFVGKHNQLNLLRNEYFNAFGKELSLHAYLGLVIQTAGKVIGFGGFGTHWDGIDLKERLTKDLNNALAVSYWAVRYYGFDLRRVEQRVSEKFERFEGWRKSRREAPP